MRRFFIDKRITAGEKVELSGEEARHMLTVLRMKAGDELILINGSGVEMLSRIINCENGCVRLEALQENVCEAEPANRVTLFQCLPKAGKMELIVQKCVELGVCAVQPVHSKRCVVKPERNESKSMRYNRVSQEAAKQCGRSTAPEVLPVIELQSADFSGFDLVLIAYEGEENVTLKQILTSFKLERGGAPAEIAAVIGPEGGFEPEEVERLLAANQNAHSISLGKRILRTETAGMALLAMLMYELEG